MGHSPTHTSVIKQNQNNGYYKIKQSVLTINFPIKSPEEDQKVRKTCSAQEYEIIIIIKSKSKFEIICGPIHLKISTFLSLDQ